jgi:glucokinase
MADDMTTRATASTLLVGDIGGTRTRLSLYDGHDKRLLVEAILPSREYDRFEDVARQFLSASTYPIPAVAVFGVAGPVRGQVASVTNLKWRMDAQRLERILSIPKVILVNDLVVAARGCLHLSGDIAVPLGGRKATLAGRDLAVISAGTGLGEAFLFWNGDRHLVVPTEGGHADFAPRSTLEIELWQFLARRHADHVSYERVLSGDGLGAIYDFFASKAGREPKAIGKKLSEGDRNAAIAELGLSGTHDAAKKAVDLFAKIYGAEAGNLALKGLTLGGVFVAGNIARHIVSARRESFLEGFQAKGRFAKMMSQIPIILVTDPLIGVRGALAMAREILASAPGAAKMQTKPASSKRSKQGKQGKQGKR